MGKMGTSGALLCALMASVFVVGCGDDDGPGGAGGTSGGGSGGSSGVGGRQPPPPVTCGSNECTAPEGSAASGIIACCLDDNGCGLQTPLAPKCLAPNQPGGLDLSCPGYTNPDVGIALAGCCAADGKCGALDPMTLGCIAGADLALDEQTCTFQPGNDCTAIIDVVCDGPEDCGDGQQCCGRFAGGSYDRFVCATNCDEAAAAVPGTWSEICHPGQTCSVEGYECKTSPYLPEYLYRCRDTGDLLCGSGGAMDACVAPVTSGPNEISCGDTKCGADEKCCIRTPRDPYCAPADGFCQCIDEPTTDTDAGNTDAGQ